MVCHVVEPSERIHVELNSLEISIEMVKGKAVGADFGVGDYFLDLALTWLLWGQGEV